VTPDTSEAAYSRIATVIKEVFLPQGYPDSVHSDYTAYQIWDTIQVSLNGQRGQTRRKGIAWKIKCFESRKLTPEWKVKRTLPLTPINFSHFLSYDTLWRRGLRCLHFTLQAFASTIMGTLTTHSIMRGIGVGESKATPLAAAITWILKNGTGMIGSILFAWWNG